MLLGVFCFYGRAVKSVKALVFVGCFPLPSNNKIIQIGHVTVGHRFAIIANVTLPFNINVICFKELALEKVLSSTAFYAKVGSVLSLISVASFTFFKGGNAINFVLPFACSVKVHG
ncbi:hypothetical protein D1094_14715 [Colwellia sp. RSH04]|nr:hypothetical protein D1094_14715 [Colwellia sp. RSH04]